MSLRLRDDPDAFNALVGATAAAFDVDPAFVEKDYWVTEVLRIASRARVLLMLDGSREPVSVVFKGGTSLSRVFRIIERFSEDVDMIAVFPPGASKTQRHNVFKAIDAEVVEALPVEPRVSSSDTGVHRDTYYGYEAQFSAAVLRREGVKLELGSRGGPWPSSSYPFRSMVAAYAQDVLGEEPDVWEEFRPFDVEVLGAQRTLFEKLAALHASAEQLSERGAAPVGRHYYDVWCLLRDEAFRAEAAALGAEGRAELVGDINQRSADANWKWLPRPDNGYAASAAFTPQHLLHNEVRADFDRAMGLVYGTRPSLEDVAAVVAEHADLL